MFGFPARDLLVFVGLPVLGAVAGHLWLRFRRRLARLTWTAQYQPMAFATEDLGWGRVQILYNGQPAQNLHIITVQIVNDSQVDLAAVEFNVQASEGTMVLRSQAVVRRTIAPLPFAPSYAFILAEAARRPLTPTELAEWGKRSDWQAPVLNRGTIVDARLLVARNDLLAPTVTVYCNHLGVRLRHQRPAQEFWGVNLLHAAVVGLALGMLGVLLLVSSGLSMWGVGAGAFGLGAFGSVIGAVAVRVWRWVGKLAG